MWRQKSIHKRNSRLIHLEISLYIPNSEWVEVDLSPHLIIKIGMTEIKTGKHTEEEKSEFGKMGREDGRELVSVLKCHVKIFYVSGTYCRVPIMLTYDYGSK